MPKIGNDLVYIAETEKYKDLNERKIKNDELGDARNSDSEERVIVNGKNSCKKQRVEEGYRRDGSVILNELKSYEDILPETGEIELNIKYNILTIINEFKIQGIKKVSLNDIINLIRPKYSKNQKIKIFKNINKLNEPYDQFFEKRINESTGDTEISLKDTVIERIKKIQVSDQDNLSRNIQELDICEDNKLFLHDLCRRSNAHAKIMIKIIGEIKQEDSQKISRERYSEIVDEILNEKAQKLGRNEFSHSRNVKKSLETRFLKFNDEYVSLLTSFQYSVRNSKRKFKFNDDDLSDYDPNLSKRRFATKSFKKNKKEETNHKKENTQVFFKPSRNKRIYDEERIENIIKQTKNNRLEEQFIFNNGKPKEKLQTRYDLKLKSLV